MNHSEEIPHGRPRKLKILMLHGFCQTGPFFREKTRAFAKALESELPNGVEFYYPSGSLDLWDLLDKSTAELEARSDLRAWWRNLDIVSRYDELNDTLIYLSTYIKQCGPFDGVVGFSQGAAMAMMLASLCESTASRAQALRSQSAFVHCLPPQGPFQFAMAVSGFRGTTPYYDGFYTPRISTPSMHVIADWDTMVEIKYSTLLAAACEDTKVIRHHAAHVFPSHGPALRHMLDFVQDITSSVSLQETIECAYPWTQSNPPSSEKWYRGDCQYRGERMFAASGGGAICICQLDEL